MKTQLEKGWKILQDVHDKGEVLGLYKPDFKTDIGFQISDFEDLLELKHLQLVFSNKPYFGRELRYFNIAPWWYKNTFKVDEKDSKVILKFTNVDYFCKIWVNGNYVGEHEGYSIPFEFDITDFVNYEEDNLLIVKVWSPWDEDVLDDNQLKRTFVVFRNNIKGTYEHSDCFIQRDVNPVGIYGSVTIETCSNIRFTSEPEIKYTLNEELTSADLSVKVNINNVDGKDYKLRFTCFEENTKLKVCEETVDTGAYDAYEIKAKVNDINLWSTWDKGSPNLYIGVVEILKDGEVIDSYTNKFGFRKIDIKRTETETTFYLNNKPMYVRASAYFPDIYVSNMYEERYRRDLTNFKQAGFNMIRVHVHIDLPIMYEIATELGLGIMQDSEYNWMHPISDEFADRFINIYLESVKMLKKHTSMLCWITMNEPGLKDPRGSTNGRAMTINPGPRLYESVKKLDPSRPIIKGSFCEDDLTSGDSHNYTGSLHGEDGHYLDIYGTKEKLNTEFGIDAIPCKQDLMKCPEVYKRLESIVDKIDEIQNYQYRLEKYYMEHYRMQKYTSNSGYGHFIFSDNSPQSFYGIYDYWGIAKKGVQAALESNMPQGIFLKFSRETMDEIYVVNDENRVIKNAEVFLTITNGNNEVIKSKHKTIDIPEDGIIKVWDINMNKEDYDIVNCALVVKQGNVVITKNHYEDIFNQPKHVEGHPARMDHEVGVRLFSSTYGK